MSYKVWTKERERSWHREAKRKAYWKNPNKFRAASRRWYRQNREKVARYARRYRRTHAVEMKERHKRWYKEHAKTWNAKRRRAWRRNKRLLLRKAKAWRRAHPRQQRIHNACGKYKISVAAYKRLLREQKGRCASCGVGGRLELDHDHHSGKVRRFLCRACNILAAWIERYPLRVAPVVRYLKQQKAYRDN